MTDAQGPATPVADRGRPVRRIISAVWIVPIIALLIALAIAWQSYANRGVLVAISFPDASGIEVGQTTLRYREVAVGVVEDVGFTPDLQEVNVYVRVSNNIAPYLDESAAFWIVQPEVTTRGVEGLNTILSGTYIQGAWDSEIGTPRTAFDGTERAPVVPPGGEGTAIVLRARDSSRLGPGAPILYRGIEVGEVAAPRLSPDGTEIRIDAFVRAPYDRQLSTSTRFWDASGVSVGLGAGGVDLRIGSIASIVEGGVNFDTLISGGQAIETGHVYNIFADEDSARASTFETPSARSVNVGALFPSAADGLTEGAAVRFGGVRVGSVSRITGFIRDDDPGATVQLLATLALQPSKMGLEQMSSDLDGIDFVQDLVAGGLRAQLVSTSILGGDLAVELLQVDEAPPATLEIGIAETPLIPTIDSDEGGLQATAEGLLQRFDDLPVEELLVSATDLLNNVNRIAGAAETRAIPGEVVATLQEGRGLLTDGRGVVASPAIAAVLADAERITGELRSVMDTIAERQVAEGLAATVEQARSASANVAVATEDLDALVAAARGAVAGAETILSNEDTQAIPGLARSTLEGASAVSNDPALAAILADTAAATADIRALAGRFAGTAIAEQVETALASVDEAAANVAAGTADLDQLREAIGRVVGSAQSVIGSAQVQALPGEISGLVADARDIVGDEGVQSVIADLAVIATDIREITADLVAQQAAQRLAEALASAAVAADGVAQAAEDLPALSDSAQRVLAQAEELGGNLNQLSARANALDLDALVTSTTQLMETADTFLSSDEAGDVPVVLSNTLEELRLTIETIRTGGTLENLNTTLRSAAGAADGIRATADDLPALVGRLQTLVGQAGGVLATYGEDGRVSQELYAALRAATRAAEDVSSLSRSIERNPQSLIIGR